MLKADEKDVIKLFADGVYHNLSLGRYLIGRNCLDLTHDINLNHPSVDVKHAALTIATNGISLIDLLSKTGTFLDGIRIAEMTPVNILTNAIIYFGKMKCELSIMQKANDQMNSSKDLVIPKSPCQDSRYKYSCQSFNVDNNKVQLDVPTRCDNKFVNDSLLIPSTQKLYPEENIFEESDNDDEWCVPETPDVEPNRKALDNVSDNHFICITTQDFNNIDEASNSSDNLLLNIDLGVNSNIKESEKIEQNHKKEVHLFPDNEVEKEKSQIKRNKSIDDNNHNNRMIILRKNSSTPQNNILDLEMDQKTDPRIINTSNAKEMMTLKSKTSKLFSPFNKNVNHDDENLDETQIFLNTENVETLKNLEVLNNENVDSHIAGIPILRSNSSTPELNVLNFEMSKKTDLKILKTPNTNEILTRMSQDLSLNNRNDRNLVKPQIVSSQDLNINSKKEGNSISRVDDVDLDETQLFVHPKIENLGNPEALYDENELEPTQIFDPKKTLNSFITLDPNDGNDTRSVKVASVSTKEEINKKVAYYNTSSPVNKKKVEEVPDEMKRNDNQVKKEEEIYSGLYSNRKRTRLPLERDLDDEVQIKNKKLEQPVKKTNERNIRKLKNQKIINKIRTEDSPGSKFDEICKNKNEVIVASPRWTRSKHKIKPDVESKKNLGSLPSEEVISEYSKAVNKTIKLIDTNSSNAGHLNTSSKSGECRYQTRSKYKLMFTRVDPGPFKKDMEKLVTDE